MDKLLTIKNFSNTTTAICLEFESVWDVKDIRNIIPVNESMITSIIGEEHMPLIPIIQDSIGLIVPEPRAEKMVGIRLNIISETLDFTRYLDDLYKKHRKKDFDTELPKDELVSTIKNLYNECYEHKKNNSK